MQARLAVEDGYTSINGIERIAGLSRQSGKARANASVNQVLPRYRVLHELGKRPPLPLG